MPRPMSGAREAAPDLPPYEDGASESPVTEAARTPASCGPLHDAPYVGVDVRGGQRPAPPLGLTPFAHATPPPLGPPPPSQQEGPVRTPHHIPDRARACSPPSGGLCLSA